MYEQHFGFSRSPFSAGMAQGEDIFRTPATNELIRDLGAALTRRDSVAVLSGQSGTGKTTIASDALKNIATQLAFCCISHPPLSQTELLEQLLSDFGFQTGDTSRVERLQLWRQFLTEMAATSTRVSLLVESAESWRDEVLQCLHNLTVADAELSPGANVVLTTSVRHQDMLVSADLVALNQRVRLRRQVDPLAADETRDYLDFICRKGGADAGKIFAEDVAPCLHTLSGGIVRVIDNLLESALIAAAARQEREVTAETLAAVAVDQLGMAPLPSDIVADLLTPPPMPETGCLAATDEIPILTEIVHLADESEVTESLAGVSA